MDHQFGATAGGPIPVMLGGSPAPAPGPAPGPAPAPPLPLPDGWERRALPAPDAQGRTEYFINHHDRTTHWSPPYTPPAADARELFDIHVP
eukprot:COSAG04_NODE_130_length_24323_cov_50.932835_31_plen_91_part_00